MLPFLRGKNKNKKGKERKKKKESSIRLNIQNNGVMAWRLNCLGMVEEGSWDTLKNKPLVSLYCCHVWDSRHPKGYSFLCRAARAACGLSKKSRVTSPLLENTVLLKAPSEQETDRAARRPACTAAAFGRNRRQRAPAPASPTLHCFAAKLLHELVWHCSDAACFPPLLGRGLEQRWFLQAI